MPLISSVIKYVLILKENIKPEFVRKLQRFYLLTTNDNHVPYTLVIIDTEGIKCHALTDTRERASYASSTLNGQIDKKIYHKKMQTHRNNSEFSN